MENKIMMDKILKKVNNDEYFKKALLLILDKQYASASLLQRELIIGYSRAAKYLDLMDELGVIKYGELGEKPQILLSKQDFDENLFN